MNKIIGHALAKTGIKADDVSLSVHSAIDWKTLPRHPKEWESVFQSIEDMSQINTERTFFQGLLPKDLQLRESLQIWSNDSAVAETLQRLSASVPVQVDPNCVSFFA
jgi:ATP-dependent Lhr-like helicase